MALPVRLRLGTPNIAQVAESEDAAVSKTVSPGSSSLPLSTSLIAPVVKKVNTLVLETSAFGHVGSMPTWGTILGSLAERQCPGLENRLVGQPPARRFDPYNFHQFWRNARVAYGRVLERRWSQRCGARVRISFPPPFWKSARVRLIGAASKADGRSSAAREFESRLFLQVRRSSSAWIEHPPPTRSVVGSTPACGASPN